MGRINWKENQIVSIQLKDGNHALFQMLSIKGWIAVFNAFDFNDKWEGINLTEDSILFKNFIISKTIFPKSKTVIHKNIEPVKNIVIPEIKINTGTESRKIKVWENTPKEDELIIIGGGNNLLKIENPNDKFNPEYRPIEIKDYDEVKQYELENLRIYPEFNERLWLCSRLKMNIDPLKELAFNRKLDPLCEDYIKIIGGKTKLEELGY
ncbi:hypothetical protein [Flavivirga jejuensis]|uniref:Immunity protein 26 of polymorphic toxin system n=1 Tax=Flavivirga jejuensis TaxID=870487 RepID=A0ABT8WTT1_9FLAO|nr:hypothetical protein [Flavivirga jejuensis]MDO5976588.1 hypothetical protein [Flavivirga jejuensis]